MILASTAKAAIAFVMLAGFALHATDVFATTYYVDPASGNDSNAGTSQAAPWKTIPGTFTASNSGWLRSAWGGITSTAKIQPGDVIELKAGSTITSSIGGRLLIDATYYSSGTSSAPIVIRVSSSWGTGSVTYNASGMTVPLYTGAIAISQRDYIQIKGVSASSRFIVRSCGSSWGLRSTGTSGTHQSGVVLDYMEFASNTEGGMDISFSNGWTVSNSLSHDNGTLGFGVGGNNDENAANGTFSDDEAYGNGPTANSSGTRQGFGMYGGTNITYLRCKSHNNGRDGFDFGTATNYSNSSATVINCSSYDNGEDGFGSNGDGGVTNSHTYINCISYNNVQSGWNIYGGATDKLYHCIAHNNGSTSGYSGNFMIYSEPGNNGQPALTSATLRNCIGYKPKAYANIYSYNSQGLTTTIDSDYNIFVPRSTDSEVFAETPWGVTYTYSNPPSWKGSHDKIGMASDPLFVSVSTSSFTANDYHISVSITPATNAGLYISSPSAAATDRAGISRANPPEIGMYEYGSVSSTLTPPSNLRITP